MVPAIFGGGGMSAEETLRFIEDYRIHSILWDTKNKNYCNKTRRNKALLEIGAKYGMDIQTVKNKIKSLRSYFAREKHKGLKRKSDEEEYVSQWFAFNSLSFIQDSITQNDTSEGVEFDSLIEESRPEDFPRTITDLQPTSSSRNGIAINSFSKPTTNNSARVLKKPPEAIPEGEETYSLVKVVPSNPPPAGHWSESSREEFNIFGQMVVAKLMKLSPRNQVIAQHRINNFLFTLEMQELDAADSAATSHNNSDSGILAEYLNFQ